MPYLLPIWVHMGNMARTSPHDMMKSSYWMHAFETIDITFIEVPLVVEIDVVRFIEERLFSFGHKNLES